MFIILRTFVQRMQLNYELLFPNKHNQQGKLHWRSGYWNNEYYDHGTGGKRS